MPRPCPLLAVLVALAASLLVAPATAGAAHRFDFGLVGDAPYTAEEEPKVDRMWADIDRRHLAFVAHDGDIKGGGTPCTDEVLLRERARLDRSLNPVVYVPGDNEWTDCHRTGGDPLERLRRLRELFFQGSSSLGQRRLEVIRQSADYPENVRWTHPPAERPAGYGRVTFLGLNVPGSNNNLGRTPEADAEYAARNAADLAWLREGFATAVTSRAVVVVIQANPGFELAPERRTGYNDLIGALEREAVAFGRPVLVVHGDTHTFRIDRPLLGGTTGRPVVNLTRVETFGSPDVHWVRVGVDLRRANPFSFTPELVQGN
jgi:hypothetical protein